ncbi:MAG: A24 family peptidase [Alphaproteobacteria bacterium]|nr:A24 family peptidase [Alphaproteobacteria bacterium]
MDYENILYLILEYLAGGALGLASAGLACHFGTRSAERLPGESMMPQCLFCMRPLEWHEAFPFFGWLLRKNARALPCPCGDRKGLWLLPLTEFIGFLMGMTVVALTGWDVSIIPLCLGIGLLPAIASIDLAFGIIPDTLNGMLAALGLIWIMTGDGDLFMALINSAGLLLFGILLAVGYSKLRGRDMLGMGDVKFFAAAGLWLPIELIPWFFVTAGVSGAAIGVIWQLKGGDKEFPFAPALCLSLAACVFYALY